MHAPAILRRTESSLGAPARVPEGLVPLSIQIDPSTSVLLNVSELDAQRAAGLKARSTRAVTDVPTGIRFTLRLAPGAETGARNLRGTMIVPTCPPSSPADEDLKAELANAEARQAAIEEAGDEEFVRWLARIPAPRRNEIATEEERRQVVALRKATVGRSRATKILGCTLFEIDKWTKEGRIIPLYRSDVATFGGFRYLIEDLEAASARTEDWRQIARQRMREHLNYAREMRDERRRMGLPPVRELKCPRGMTEITAFSAFAHHYFQQHKLLERGNNRRAQALRMGNRTWRIWLSQSEAKRFISEALCLAKVCISDPTAGPLHHSARKTLERLPEELLAKQGIRRSDAAQL